MKIIHRAQMKFPDQHVQSLALFQVESTVFRWISEGTGQPFNGVDYLRSEDAIKGLRVLVESDPGYVGVDLTVLPVDLPPAERAAKRILETLDDKVPYPDVLEWAAKLIQEETQIDGLIEAVNLLITYEFPRRLHPKKPGLDMVWGGLVLSILECMEKAQKVDLTNLKKQLAEGIETVKVYSSMPAPKMVN